MTCVRTESSSLVQGALHEIENLLGLAIGAGCDVDSAIDGDRVRVVVGDGTLVGCIASGWPDAAGRHRRTEFGGIASNEIGDSINGSFVVVDDGLLVWIGGSKSRAPGS